MAKQHQFETILIIGGGFAGLSLAKKLQKSRYQVILLDRQNHHMFQPLFYQVASARLEPSSITFPFRKIFQKTRNIHFVLGEVIQILPEQNILETNSGNIHYDHLVIGAGCQSHFYGQNEIEKHALGMKTTGEAIQIRNRLLEGFEKWASQGKLNGIEPLNITVVGGGPTGVEMAGALSEMKSNILPKDYPDYNFSALRISLVEGSSSLLRNMSQNAKDAALEYLQKMGVEVYLNAIVNSYDGNILQLRDGRKWTVETLIWGAGVQPVPMPGLPEQSTTPQGRIRTDRFHKVFGTLNIYAIGDIAYMETPLFPKGHPQLANVAINQGKNLGKNFLKQGTGKSLNMFEYKDLGSMATIGKHKAVVDLPFAHFKGKFAWFFWMFLHLMLILSVRNKLFVFFNWAWSYFTSDTSLRLILKPGKNKKENDLKNVHPPAEQAISD